MSMNNGLPALRDCIGNARGRAAGLSDMVVRLPVGGGLSLVTGGV